MRSAVSTRANDPLAWLEGHADKPRFLHWDLEAGRALAGAGVTELVRVERWEHTNAALERARRAGGEWFAFVPFDPARSAHDAALLIKPAICLVGDVERTQGEAIERPVFQQSGRREEGDFVRRVARGLEHIARGDVDKVVLAHAFERAMTRPPLDVLRGLTRNNPSGTALYLELDGQGVLGVTPERLFRREGTRFWIDCLAGTAPLTGDRARDDAAAERLLNDDKERREHDFVVSAVREALEGHARFVDVPGKPRVRHAGRVQHLWTPVRGELLEPRSLLARLHPTPAVAGTPRSRAVELAFDLEPFDRGLYAGAFGRLCGDDEDFSVVLRSTRFGDGRATVYAGAGIVRGSRPEREWLEVQQKAAALLEALA